MRITSVYDILTVVQDAGHTSLVIDEVACDVELQEHLGVGLMDRTLLAVATPFDVEAGRKQLVDMLSSYSEDHYAASWMGGIERDIRRIGDGTLWEVMARIVGWPVGYRGEDGWTTWDEAVR